MMMETDNLTEAMPAAETIQDVEMADGGSLRVEAQMAAAESGTCESGAVSSAAAAKIARIVDDYARLASVSAAEIGRKRQAVRAKCQERLWMAAAWRDYQLEQAQKAFEADLKALEKEHQVEFASLKDSLLQELQEERKRLQQAEASASLTIDRTGNLVPGSISGIGANSSTGHGNGDAESVTPTAETAEEVNGAAGRRLRRRDERSTAGLLEGGTGFLGLSASQGTATAGSVASGTSSGPGAGQSSAAGATGTAASNRRRPANSNANIYTYNTLLGDQEILDDLGRIAKEAGSVVPTRRAAKTATSAVLDASKGSNSNPGSTSSTSYSVSVDRGVLNYQWDRVNVGDRLRVRVEGVVSFGKVTHITDNDLSLRMGQGASTAKTVPLADLRSGRVVLLLDDHSTRDDL